MPSTFLNAHRALTTTDTTVYTANSPGTRSVVIHGLYFSNTSDLTGTTVTLSVYDATTTTLRRILNKVPIAPNSTLVLEKPINLKPNDELRAKSSNIYCEAFASVLLLT